MVLSTAGCSNSTSSSSSGGSTPGKKVVLTGLIQQSRNYSGLQDMVKKLKAEQNIEIDFQVIPDEQYDNLLKMKVNSGEAPDLIGYQYPQIFAAINPENYFMPMDGQSWISKEVSPNLAVYNGKNYGYVFEASNGFQGLIYNQDVFKAQGITELPKTVDEFNQDCDKLKAANITPIAMPSDTWVPQIWMTSGFSRSFGTDAACKDFANNILTNKKKFSDYPQMANVVDQYTQLFKKGYVNSDYLTVGYDDVLKRLADGKAAMIYGATEILTSIEESYPNSHFAIFNPPVSYDKNDILVTLPTSLGIAVSKNTKNLDTIKKVFDLWSQPDYGDLYFAKRPGFPNIKGINGYQEKMNKSITSTYDQYVKAGKTVSEMNQYLNTVQPLFGSTLWVYFEEAPSKGLTGADVMNKFQGDVSKFMAENKAKG